MVWVPGRGPSKGTICWGYGEREWLKVMYKYIYIYIYIPFGNQAMSNRMPGRLPDEMSGRMPDEMSGRMPDGMSGGMPDGM